MMPIKLVKPTDPKSSSAYQTTPVLGTGIGRFQVYKTDNANARAVGRRPKWTVYDLYGNPVTARAELDTLAEVREWIERQRIRTRAGN